VGAIIAPRLGRLALTLALGLSPARAMPAFREAALLAPTSTSAPQELPTARPAAARLAPTPLDLSLVPAMLAILATV